MESDALSNASRLTCGRCRGRSAGRSPSLGVAEPPRPRGHGPTGHRCRAYRRAATARCRLGQSPSPHQPPRLGRTTEHVRKPTRSSRAQPGARIAAGSRRGRAFARSERARRGQVGDRAAPVGIHDEDWPKVLVNGASLRLWGPCGRASWRHNLCPPTTCHGCGGIGNQDSKRWMRRAPCSRDRGFTATTTIPDRQVLCTLESTLAPGKVKRRHIPQPAPRSSTDRLRTRGAGTGPMTLAAGRTRGQAADTPVGFLRWVSR